MDHRDRAVGMMDQPGADRAEQGPLQRVLPAAADHHHVRLFGQVDKAGHGRRTHQFTVDLGSVAILHAVFGDLDRIGDHFPPLSSCQLATSAGIGAAGHASDDELAAGVWTTFTRVSRILRIIASRVAHRTASLEDGDPSTPTTTPGCVLRPDISPSFLVRNAGCDRARCRRR